MDKLLKRAIEASSTAYAPYSGFCVGAAVELESGEIVVGSNQECASYSLTICAERVALAAALSNFPNGVVRRIAIYSPQSPSGIAPCGACREFIMECARRGEVDIEIIGIDGEHTTTISALLPHSFILPKNSL